MKGESKLRDPKRIPKLLKVIEELWSNMPDMRLLQLLINVSSKSSESGLFYMEDEMLLSKLEQYAEHCNIVLESVE